MNVDQDRKEAEISRLKRTVVLYPSMSLREVSAPHIPGMYPDLWKGLEYTMNSMGGVGIAAVQVGIPRACVIVNAGEDGRGRHVMYNPKLVEASEEMEISHEGCLSCPGLYTNIKRHRWVDVSYLKEEDGERVQYRFGGLESFAVQHELDHLKGKLIVDRVSYMKRDIYRRKTVSIRRKLKARMVAEVK